MVLLLLLTGLETDVRLLRHLGRSALTSSAIGMIIPFACGFALGMFMPAEYPGAIPSRRILFALFLATAMSISAMPVIAKILMDLELTKRNIGDRHLVGRRGRRHHRLADPVADRRHRRRHGRRCLSFAADAGAHRAFLAACCFVFYPLARWLFARSTIARARPTPTWR